MKKLTEDQKLKIKAGLELLCEENTSLDKIQKLSHLIKGTNHEIDKKLKTLLDIAGKIKKVQEGDVITLSVENLPEDNDKNKKRKKLILLLLSSWKDLSSEVSRIQDLQNVASATGIASKETLVKGGKIAATAKGPLGVVTVIAAGVVAVGAFLNNKAVDITVKNIGCRPIEPLIEQRINLPGLKLPSEAILSGGDGIVTLPGLDFTLDATQQGTILISALNFSRNYSLPYEIKDITYEGKSLMDKTTLIKLSNSKTHEVVVVCAGKSL